MVLARIRAQVVLPTPRGPQKRNACANCLFLIAFLSVVVMCCCPTTVLNVCGRYLRAETINFSIIRLQVSNLPGTLGKILCTKTVLTMGICCAKEGLFFIVFCGKWV